TMAGVDVDTLTMEQYLALSRENQAPGVIKPEIGGNVNFEIKSQFMRELREDTFSRNKDEDAHDHIDRGPIPEMRQTQALIAIQTMADHSQKWHDGTTTKNIKSSSNKDGLATLVNKTSPRQGLSLNEEAKQIEEVRYREFRRTAPLNKNNGGKFHVGPPRYYTKADKRPPFEERRQSLEELLAKHQKESARRSTKMEIEQLAKEIHSDKILNSSSEQVKIVTSDQETSGLNKLHGVSFISGPGSNTPEVLQHQLPPKELNPGSFTLPCMIGKFNFYAMADLGASINVMPRSIFEHLQLIDLKKTNMLFEMADMSKKAPLGIVENVLVKIDKLLFPANFVILDNTPSETTILGRPFLATIHAEIDVYTRKISLGMNENRISFDTMRKDHNYTNPKINKLADEYELGIGKKGHILDNIWDNCNLVHNKNYEWHNYEFKNEEYEEIGIEEKDYHPPEVQVETFEVKKYSFKGGQSFICVTKDLDNILPPGRKNGSKFKEMIRKEVEKNKTYKGALV
ncbi:zinc knuckle CX2CX4HX4C containing protein, partial [Tanacetum coccineum]